MIILKEEVNQLSAEHLALARWKLIVVGAFSILGFGWGQGAQPSKDTGLLILCSIGFLCLYIDLLIYRRNTAIHAIGRYLRNYEGDDAETKELREYEIEINKLRRRSKIFYSERWAQILSSLVFSGLLPLIGYINYKTAADWRICIPIAAIFLQIILYIAYAKNRSSLTEVDCDA